jgi:hypothetical protein
MLLPALMICGLISATVRAQGGTQTLFGDFKVNESGVPGATKPLTYQLILYADSGVVAARQTISNGGRFRFMNLPNGVFFLAIEHESVEITRVRVELLRSNYKADFRQDIELEWRAPIATNPSKASNISVADNYTRSSLNQKRFDKAEEAANAKKNEEAVTLFKGLLVDDPNDFQAWTELGTA